MDTNGRPALSPEEQASVKATEDRLLRETMDVLDRTLEEIPSPEEYERNKGFHEALGDRYSALLEVHRYEQEMERKFFAEFDALLWETDRKRVRPEGYLALCKLRDTLCAPGLLSRVKGWAEEHEHALSEIGLRGETRANGGCYPSLVGIEGAEFVFTREDVPYLLHSYIEHRMTLARMAARERALRTVLGGYEYYGEPRPLTALQGSLGGFPAGQPSALEGRGLDYFTAILELIGQPFDSPTAYAKAIADLAPKEDGDPPEYTAVFGWLRDNGLRKPGQGLDDFRPQLEREARRVLGFLRGDGWAGKPPRVRP